MKILTVIIFLVFVGNAHAIKAFKNCSQSDINNLFDHTRVAKSKIEKWLEELDRYEDLNIIHRTKISIAKGILNCSYRKLDKIKYKCNSIDSHSKYAAMTAPIIFRKVRLSTDFFESRSDTITGLLIHEASHKCGTSDALYFRSTKARSHPLVPWSLIGDTYQYWAENGFCLPDYDC